MSDVMEDVEPSQYVVEDLDEEEAYLFALLMDEAGIDQTEFLFYDAACEDDVEIVRNPDGTAVRDDSDEVVRERKYRTPTGCWRAWDFQVGWWRCTESKQIDQLPRSMGKSQSILSRAIAFVFRFDGSEMMVTAPELIHLEPIVGKIERAFYDNWVLSQFLPRGRSAVTHRPFEMNLLNGSFISGRIPQRDGKGVKGAHPVWLEQDEAQDYPGPGWTELTQTLKRGTEGVRWRAHGVTRGVRDNFYERSQPESTWFVHQFYAMHRPSWTDKEREDSIAEYGSRDDPDYRRNVLGLHGDATNPIFVLTQLMKNVDIDPISDYNAGEYFKRIVKADELERQGIDITALLDFPMGHLSYLGTPAEQRKVLDGKAQPKAIYWVGMDIGRTIDPSEILVFVEYREKPKDQLTKLKLLTRIGMHRMPMFQQTLAVLHVIDFYKPKVFAFDKNGIGWGVWEGVQHSLDAIADGRLDEVPSMFSQYDLQDAATRIKGYAFGQQLIIGLDSTIELDERDERRLTPEQIATKKGQRREAKDYSTDQLRMLIDQVRFVLPWDEDFLRQFQGATWTAVKGGISEYGRRQFSKGNDHCLDAAREMALGWAQYSIEEFISTPRDNAPVLDLFVG